MMPVHQTTLSPLRRLTPSPQAKEKGLPQLEITYEPEEANKAQPVPLGAAPQSTAEAAAEPTMKKEAVKLLQLGGLRTTEPGRRAPLGWRETWDRIVRFRAEHKAPVDTMGCGSMANAEVRPEVQRFQTLVGLMLSSQTRDQSTHKAMQQLQRNLPNGVSVESVLNTPEEDIAKLIRPVTYYAQKAKNIKKTAVILHSRYRDDIPSTFKGLTELPGVGPKMSHLCMQYAWGKTEGIGVDTHVHRISNRLGWVHATTPEATRKQLEEWLPHEHWKTINNLFVGFGQLICTPTYPKCAECPVNELCPTGRATLRLGSPPVDR